MCTHQSSVLVVLLGIAIWRGKWAAVSVPIYNYL